MVQKWRNYTKYYVVPYIGEREVRYIDGAVGDALCETARRGPRQG